MTRKLRLPLLLLLVTFCTSSIIAQKILHKANKQFRLKHYHEAIDSYLKTLDSYPENLEAKSKLAESYRMTNQLDKAANAYSIIMPEEFVDPIYIRNYGITLMKMARYNDAHYQFELYKIYDAQDAQHYQLSCEFAHHLYKKEQKFEIEHVGVNTPNSDFGVTYLNDKLVFSSFRNDIELSDNAKNSGQVLSGNMLYIAELQDDLRAKNVRFLRSGISEKKNIGPISYATNAKICAFTRNKIENGGAHVTGDDSYHSIYIAELKPNGDWYNERPFRYNEFGTSTGFPSLAFDGNALYFASNRVGGFGGYDIYVSYYKKGTWTYPENLGEDINSPGNEITPFYNGVDLYFASDYHHGMGGYDIFHSEVVGGIWAHPTNMANGINSPSDDYYPSIKEDTEGIFFSSNRLGGRGMDDIYLAMPIEMELELAGVDILPEAVALSTMDSTIDPLSTSNNPVARKVADNNVMEIKVINPEYKEPTKEVKTEEKEELPMWGFARPVEDTQVNKEPREMEGVLKVTSIIPMYVLRTNSTNIHDDLNITIPGSRSSWKLNELIVDLDAELKIASSTMLGSTETAIETEQINVEENETIEPESKKIEVSNPNLSFEETTPQTETLQQTPIEKEVLDDIVSDLPAIEVEEQPESYKIPDYAAISANRAPFNLDLTGARRVAIGERLPTSNVYFIQLAALSKSSGNVSHFKKLSKYGNLYKVFKSTSTKIKLGYFLDKSEANAVLKSVKAKGFSDAFITKDDLGEVQLELIIANQKQETSYQSYSDKPTTTTTTTNTNTTKPDYEYSLNMPGKSDSYKIRLASYEDPIWFDIDKARTLGKIEQWTKGSWTIFILGGYGTYQEAEAAMIRAVNKGFSDAEIVIDNNGILERLRKN